MPDELGLSKAALYGTEVSLAEYITRLTDYVNRMVDYEAIPEDMGRYYLQMSLSMIQASYPEAFQEFLVGNQKYEEEVTKAEAKGKEIDTAKLFEKSFKKIAEISISPDSINTRQLPFYQVVVSPIAYQQDYVTRAAQYGEDVNKAAIAGLKAGEAAQDSYINEWLNYNESVARTQSESEQAVKDKANQKEMLDFVSRMAQQKLRLEAETKQKEETELAWEKEARLFRERPSDFRESIPPAGAVAQEFMGEERSPALQRFVEGKMGDVVSEFYRTQGGARKAWQRAISEPSYEEALQASQAEAERQKALLLTPGRATSRAITQPMSELNPAEYESRMAGSRYLEAEAEYQKLAGLTKEQQDKRNKRSEKEDPLKEYLAQYPWEAEFFKLSPRQRGFNPALYSPKARWIT